MATITLMAEPGRAANETAAETVAQDVGKTDAVPNSTPTDAVELAWSDNSDRSRGRRRPGRGHPERAGRCPAVMARDVAHRRDACGGRSGAGRGHRCGALGVGDDAVSDKYREPACPNQISTAAPPSATATAPSSIASTPDQDDKYIQALNDKGISFANPGAAIYNGKTVCQNIGQGMTVQEVVAAFRASSPAFSANANDFVAISVRAYCPQHSNLVARVLMSLRPRRVYMRMVCKPGFGYPLPPTGRRTWGRRGEKICR